MPLQAPFELRLGMVRMGRTVVRFPVLLYAVVLDSIDKTFNRIGPGTLRVRSPSAGRARTVSVRAEAGMDLEGLLSAIEELEQRSVDGQTPPRRKPKPG